MSTFLISWGDDLPTLSDVSFLPLLARYLEAFNRLGNPYHVLFKRAFAKPYDLMTVEDRQSGVRCRCTVGSYQMFGGVWYSREYDVPGVPIRSGDTVLDIGANQGFFTCYGANRGARVYAFEPNPESFDRLVSNVAKNGLMDRVTAEPLAITDRNGRAELLVSNELGGGMTTVNSEFAQKTGLSVRKTVEVPCHTLAQIFDHYSFSRVRLCKIDAEGSEIAILRTLLPRHLAIVDSFAIEMHPQAYSLRDLAQVILGWGTHQVGFNDKRTFSASIMRLVSNRLLLDGDCSSQDQTLV